MKRNMLFIEEEEEGEQGMKRMKMRRVNFKTH